MPPHRQAAEQTPLIAARAVALLREVGIPEDAATPAMTARRSARR
jgi:delta 1-pyrroline-5-carboxylate dehydrogenase